MPVQALKMVSGSLMRGDFESYFGLVADGLVLGQELVRLDKSGTHSGAPLVVDSTVATTFSSLMYLF